MWGLSLVSFLLLGGYLSLMALRFGVPDMVSDTYYQLPRGKGWLFTLVMLAVSLLTLVCVLDSGRGVQCLAFLGCSGLAFVGIAPNYSDRDEGVVHKSGAVVAAVGCTLWCLTACPWPTLILAFLYMSYLCAISLFKALNSIWYISAHPTFHPWYWAEVAAFMDVFVTYWAIM